MTGRFLFIDYHLFTRCLPVLREYILASSGGKLKISFSSYTPPFLPLSVSSFPLVLVLSYPCPTPTSFLVLLPSHPPRTTHLLCPLTSYVLSPPATPPHVSLPHLPYLFPIPLSFSATASNFRKSACEQLDWDQSLHGIR